MSIAYLDPGNIESDLQSGAVAQFKVSNQLADRVYLVGKLTMHQTWFQFHHGSQIFMAAVQIHLL